MHFLSPRRHFCLPVDIRGLSADIATTDLDRHNMSICGYKFADPGVLSWGREIPSWRSYSDQNSKFAAKGGIFISHLNSNRNP